MIILRWFLILVAVTEIGLGGFLLERFEAGIQSQIEGDAYQTNPDLADVVKRVPESFSATQYIIETCKPADDASVFQRALPPAPVSYGSLDDLLKARSFLDGYAQRTEVLKNYLLGDFKNSLQKIADTLAQHQQGEPGKSTPEKSYFVLQLVTEDAAERIGEFDKSIAALQALQAVSERDESKATLAAAIKELQIYQNLLTPPSFNQPALNDAAKLHILVLGLIDQSADLITSDWQLDKDIETADAAINDEISKASSAKSAQLELTNIGQAVLIIGIMVTLFFAAVLLGMAFLLPMQPQRPVGLEA